MNKIPFYYYISFNNPDGAKAVIESFGYEVHNVKDRKDLASCVKQLIQLRGETAIDALAKVHPDRDLILDTAEKGASSQLSDDGSSTTVVNPAPDTQNPATDTQNKQTDYTPILIAGMFMSAIIITAAIIVKK